LESLLAGQPEFGDFVLATAAFMIVAMWISSGSRKSREKNCWRKFGNTCPESPASLLQRRMSAFGT
jgi:hypothetical protein